MKLARRAGSTSARRAHDARRAGLMSWLSGHLNGVILQTFTKLLYECSSTSARRASSSSQLHRVNGVLIKGSRSVVAWLNVHVNCPLSAPPRHFAVKRFITRHHVCLVFKSAAIVHFRELNSLHNSPGPSRSCDTAADGAESSSQAVRPCV